MTRISNELETGIVGMKKIELGGQSNCWICEGWSYVNFKYEVKKEEWQGKEVIGVWLNMNIDVYKGDKMQEVKPGVYAI